MCKCTPNLKTPFCGKPGCVWPISGTNRPSALDVLCDEHQTTEDGAEIWFAVYNLKAVRGQPMALFRTRADAELVGRGMTLSECEIQPVTIRLPSAAQRPQAPMPPITVIGG